MNKQFLKFKTISIQKELDHYVDEFKFILFCLKEDEDASQYIEAFNGVMTDVLQFKYDPIKETHYICFKNISFLDLSIALLKITHALGYHGRIATESKLLFLEHTHMDFIEIGSDQKSFLSVEEPPSSYQEEIVSEFLRKRLTGEI